jgi:NAD(P)-dependent dehydrogenase (short-subunit alcohol dehydrogenase family)
VGPGGLIANLISPGYVAETGFFHGTLTDQRRAAPIERTRNGRVGQPSDIAETSYFLAGRGARHITRPHIVGAWRGFLADPGSYFRHLLSGDAGLAARPRCG